MNKNRRNKKIMLAILCIIFVFMVFFIVSFIIDIHKSYNRLNDYEIEIINTEFGNMSYVDMGVGNAILISHGIFGGYDQGYTSLYNLVGENYRKISISRFGYPGSELPSEPTPENQAKVFKNLLDHLNIEKAYILATSAGGAAAIQFVIDYPDRVKGLILLSSGVPSEKKATGEIAGMTGPPAIILNDFMMWLFTKYFSFIFKSMFASDIDENLYMTMLPVNPRKNGIIADTNITNIDMDINFDSYPVENIIVSIIVIHAKDDPMVKYDIIERFIFRTIAETKIFDTGGHLISGHGQEVYIAIRDFIERTK